MSPEQVDGYRTAGDNLRPVVDWFINVIATYGITTVIAVETVAILAAMCGIGAVSRAIARRRQRRADHDTCDAIWNLTSPRKEDTP